MYKSSGNNVFRKINASLAILGLMWERNKKVLTRGIFQVAVGVNCGIHDVGTWLVNTKRLQKNTCKHKLKNKQKVTAFDKYFSTSAVYQ